MPRQKARAKPEGAAIHQKDTVTGVFLFGHSIVCTPECTTESKIPLQPLQTKNYDRRRWDSNPR